MSELRAWWRAAQLPALASLDAAQARTVLDHIAELEWSTRPFA